MSDQQNAEQPTSVEEVRPTYAPAAMAMGIMLLTWGILTHWFMSLVGAGMISWSLFTWMHEICVCDTVGQASSPPAESEGQP